MLAHPTTVSCKMERWCWWMRALTTTGALLLPLLLLPLVLLPPLPPLLLPPLLLPPLLSVLLLPLLQSVLRCCCAAPRQSLRPATTLGSLLRQVRCRHHHHLPHQRPLQPPPSAGLQCCAGGQPGSDWSHEARRALAGGLGQ